MKRWLPVLAGLLIATPVWGDRAPPARVAAPPQNGAPLVIQVDPTAQQARLMIPKEMLAKLRADAGAEPKSGFAGLHTVVAGLSLAMALAFSGLWLARHRGQFGGKALVLIVGAGTSLLVGGAAMVWADVAPRPRPPQPVPAVANGNVIIDVVDKGTEVKLIITREQLLKLNGGAQPLPIRPLPPGEARPLPAPVPGVIKPEPAPIQGQGVAPAILPVEPPRPAPGKP